ncbi:hypothetical protein LguiB_003599 [Lonicera macranthoides]
MSWDGDWDWAGLPQNIIDEILDRLVSLSDYIRFGAVCLSWRSAALDDRNHRGLRGSSKTTNDLELLQDRQLPMLMVPHRTHDDRARFYSITHDKILDDFQLRVPHYNKRFIGSSFGWLISLDTTDLSITLFNPFSASTIRLPPFPVPPKHDDYFDYDNRSIHLPELNLEYYFTKAILSADPASHPDDYIVMLIYGLTGRLAYIRPGAGAAPGQWAYFQPLQFAFCDIIYSKSSSLFYALGWIGDVCSIDIDKEKANWFTPALKIGRPPDLRYIVETRGGDLLQVHRFIHKSFGRSPRTGQIKVFKLDKTTTTAPVWVELKSLGDSVLFVGDCASICVAASDFPGCRPGSIYFSLPFLPGLLVKQKPFRNRTSYDMGVANIQELACNPCDYDKWLPNSGYPTMVVTGIALPSGFDKLYTGSKDETVRAWDCQSGQAWNAQTATDLSLSGPVGKVQALVVGSDLLFAGTQDGTILAWGFNAVTNCFEPTASHNSQTRTVVTLVVGANMLYSGSMDNSIRLWNLETLRCIQTLTEHGSVVMSVLCWDQFLLSCSLDKTIKIFGLFGIEGGRCHGVIFSTPRGARRPDSSGSGPA